MSPLDGVGRDVDLKLSKRSRAIRFSQSDSLAAALKTKE
jgi:hypothetical protein